MTELRAYLNDPKLKADFLAQIAEHEAADAIIKGTYGRVYELEGRWQTGKRQSEKCSLTSTARF